MSDACPSCDGLPCRCSFELREGDNLATGDEMRQGEADVVLRGLYRSIMDHIDGRVQCRVESCVACHGAMAAAEKYATHRRVVL